MKLACCALTGLLAIALGGFAFPALAAECSATALDREAILLEVRGQLVSSGIGDGLELELEPVGELPALEQPKLRLLGRGLRSRVAVELSGEKCGRTQTVTVWFKLHAHREAWVYGQNVKAGRPSEQAELRRERVDLAGAQLMPGELADAPQGLWLKQDVRAGMPVLARHLQPEPLVKRDQLVRVVVRGPGLMVSTEGRAMRPGMLGDDVPVLLNGTDSSLLAVVSGKGEVHVGQ